MKRLYIFVWALLAVGSIGAQSLSNNKGKLQAQVNPLQLTFHRLAVRRFLFTNNIPLSELKPSEVVAFNSMHPSFKVCEVDTAKAGDEAQAELSGGCLVLSSPAGEKTSQPAIYAGGINPYATYELDVRSVQLPAGGSPVEVGIDLATLGLRNRVQVMVRYGGDKPGVYLRIFTEARMVKEVLYSEGKPLQPPYLLQLQLSGNSLAIFSTRDGKTTYIGHTTPKEHFGEAVDFRNRKLASSSTFNIAASLPPASAVTIGKACSYLSPGVGQADVRFITHKDGSPLLDDNRLWFTFSCRGLGIDQSAQGVMSFNPSVFDLRFEGMIVFDHGDGLLRNDYASHLFYDDDAREWKAYACDFGGVAGREGRGASGLVTATSSHDPRHGFSVMKAKVVTNENVPGSNEDPCIIYDSSVKKWRLLTSSFVEKNIRASIFESNQWNGKFTKIGGPVPYNSTGTVIQKIGGKRYAFIGGNGPMRVYSYPELTALGELKFDLPPHWPGAPGRIWANIISLPAGFPYRYMLLTMDRPNFPDVKGSNWSYGALYLYGAYTDDISNQ